MNDSLAYEAIFWLDGWADQTDFFYRKGRFKCSITKNKIMITSDLSMPEICLEVSIDSIPMCIFEYPSLTSPNRFVRLIMGNQGVVLCPVNPFNPKHTFHTNMNEATSLLRLINIIKANSPIDVEANPYLRELPHLSKKDSREFSTYEWDKDVSPWKYMELRGDKYSTLKMLTLIGVGAMGATLLVMAIFFILDWLKII